MSAALELEQPLAGIRRVADRVLVIDDESAIVSVETEVLKVAGYETVGVIGPEDALLQPIESFDVVVTDFRMPGTDGLHLFQELRHRNPHLVGVLVTGYGSLKLVKTAMSAGFHAILLKPFPLERLTHAVERALRQQRLTEENHRLEAILDIYSLGQQLNRPRHRGELATLLGRLVREDLPADEAAVLLADPRRPVLHRPREAPPLPEWVESLAGRPIHDALAAVWGGDWPDVRLAMDLTCSGQPEGLLLLRRSEPLDELAMERLALLCNQAALVLSHLRLFEERLRDEKLALVGRISGAICQRVQGPVESIRRVAQGLEVDEPEYRTMILENAARLQGMCGELSDFVTGEESIDRRPCALRRLLEDLVRQQRPALQCVGVHLHLDAPFEIVVPVDERKLSHALENLLKNAAEAMPEGGTTVLRLRATTENAVIQVEDSGHGMTPEVQSQVFEPFFSHGKVNGTGLGGAIVHTAVKAHGGAVEVASSVGHGTTFTISLPRGAEQGA